MSENAVAIAPTTRDDGDTFEPSSPPVAVKTIFALGWVSHVITFALLIVGLAVGAAATASNFVTAEHLALAEGAVAPWWHAYAVQAHAFAQANGWADGILFVLGGIALGFFGSRLRRSVQRQMLENHVRREQAAYVETKVAHELPDELETQAAMARTLHDHLAGKETRNDGEEALMQALSELAHFEPSRLRNHLHDATISALETTMLAPCRHKDRKVFEAFVNECMDAQIDAEKQVAAELARFEAGWNGIEGRVVGLLKKANLMRQFKGQAGAPKRRFEGFGKKLKKWGLITLGVAAAVAVVAGLIGFGII